MAESGNQKRESIIKQLRLREQQRSTAKKINFLRGKLQRNSTTMVTVKSQDGGSEDITDKRSMEKAIIASNKKNSKRHSLLPSTTTHIINYSGIKVSLQHPNKCWTAHTFPLLMPVAT
jgi:3-hydroxyacyl-CoA dehydrogenase